MVICLMNFMICYKQLLLLHTFKIDSVKLQIPLGRISLMDYGGLLCIAFLSPSMACGLGTRLGAVSGNVNLVSSGCSSHAFNENI